MNCVAINEWYDGKIQFVLEHSGRYFYGICVDVDFNALEEGRSFIVIPVSRDDISKLDEAFSIEDAALVNKVLPRVLEGKLGSIVRGATDSWDVNSMRFEVDTDEYRDFFRFPVVDFLASRPYGG